MTLAGHGCPRWCEWIVAAAIVCACAGWFSSAQAQDVTFELRVVWGGGPARSLAGSIRATDGSLEIVRNLSVQDDAAAAVLPTGRGEIAIRPHSPSNFGGVDLKVKGKLDSQLQFELREPGSSEPAKPLQVSFKQLLAGREVLAIDSRGSKLALERPLHDRVRVQLNRGQTIFRSGEAAQLAIEGYRTNLPAGDYRVNVRLQEATSDRALVQLHQDVSVDDQGNFAAANFSNIALPDRPGAYAFEISIARRRLINTLMNTGTLPARRVELVIVPSEVRGDLAEQQTPATDWQLVSQVYPAGVSWWDSLGKFRIPTMKTMTPLVTQAARPLSSGDHQRLMVGNKECMVLATGAWQAFPLSIDQAGVPHRVTIQVPADAPQKLIFSVHEPSQATDAPALRLDTGMLVESGTTTVDGLVQHHMLFWPKQTHAYLLVMNADSQRSAAVAEVNLEAAPAGLQASPAHGLSRSDDLANVRTSSIYLDKPLLAENFCATRRVEGPRELDTWLTVWQSSERLAEYTQWSGHNAATVTVATQGGAIYPSRVWDPTHKFDSGTFLSDGASPEIKDWVEVMCAHFDQRGLKLILALDLEGPLAELERAALDQSASESAALRSRYQVDIEGRTARPSDDPQNTDARRPTLYNPLDPRVQSVLTKIVDEIAERYHRHPCFAGVQINLSERSHFNFAGDAWGYDSESLARFERNMGSVLPKDAGERERLLRGPLRLNFLNERAQELSVFYSRLAKAIAAHNPQAKLIINPTKLVAMPPASDNYLLAASQPLSASDLLIAAGVDCKALSNLDHAIVLRPEADSPMRTPTSRAWSYRLASDTQLDSLFANHPVGAMVQQLPTSFRLADYDKVNPFGNGRNRTWLFPHALVAGDGARRNLAHRLFQADVQHLANGGWMVPIGQEDELRELVSALQKFPPITMRDLSPAGISPTIKVRRAEHANKTYVQLINDASWSEKVVIQFKCSRETRALQFGGDDAEAWQPIAAGQAEKIQLTLPAYGLMGVCFECSDVELISISSSPPADLAQRLESRLTELQKLIDRAGELNEQQTLGLLGGDFETWESKLPKGWTTSTHPSTSVAQDHELPRSGTSCARLENRSGNNATAWIQSDRIAIPATGRLALEVWVRTLPGPTQPTVRLSLVGRYRDGKRFQRWHEFTSASEPETSVKVAAASTKGSARLPIDWGNRPLVLLVPDVPNEELAELRAAVDVVGQGTIWVDDVRVYGMYLHPDEKVHLSGQMFMAREQMRQGNYALADQMLSSFWSNFLSTYLPVETAPVQPVSTRIQEARLPARAPTPGPVWRNPNAPRLNQWQESLRSRWQR